MIPYGIGVGIKYCKYDMLGKGEVKIEILDCDLFNAWHNTAHVLSYVHGPSNRFENKDSRCWNPSASSSSSSSFVLLMLCYDFHMALEWESSIARMTC